MKKYDLTKARAIVDKLSSLDVLQEATLGMHEDWFWTAQTIWMKDHGYDEGDLQSGLIAGIAGSSWGTPVLCVEFTDGSEKYFNCYTGDHQTDLVEKLNMEFTWARGPISGDVQMARLDIIIEEFAIK